MSDSLTQKMQAKMVEGLESAFETVVNERNVYYQENPTKIPSLSEIDSKISAVALKNSAISGGASLIPGPWGMVAVVPELLLVTRNQIALIYDIAAAHGKKNLMSRELAASVFLSAMGTSAGSLLVLHGGKYLIRRASLQIFQKMIVLLGGKITQQALKSAVSKWFPGVGAAAMATWTNYMTRKIGNKAHEVFSCAMEIQDNIEDIELLNPDQFEVKESKGDELRNIEFYKIKILINLANIDGKLLDVEVGFINAMISESMINDSEKTELREYMKSSTRSLDGVDLIASSPDDAIMLLSDLTAIAKLDDQFHVTEKLYIKKVGKLLSFSEEEIEEVMAS